MADNGTQEIIDIISQRRIAQQVANRVDRLGAMLDAKMTADNSNTVTGWVDTSLANVTAAGTSPVFYIDPVTLKQFTPIK